VDLERRDEAIGGLVGQILPAPAPGDLVRVVLAPEPEHFGAGRRESVVDRAEGHRDDRRVRGRLPAQEVPARRVDLGPVAADQLQADPRLAPGMCAIGHRARQGQANHEPEAVPGSHPLRERQAVLRREQAAIGLEGMRPGNDRARGAVLALGDQPDRPAPLGQDPLHRAAQVDRTATALDQSLQRLGQGPRPAPRPGHPALVIERVPPEEGTGEGLPRRRPGLRGHPQQRRLDLVLPEVVLDHLAIRLDDQAQRPAEVLAEATAEEHPLAQLQRAGHGEERFPHGLREGSPLLEEAEVGLALPGELPFDPGRGALRVPVEEHGVTVFERREEERGQIEVLEAVTGQLELLDDRREPDEDVRAAAQVEAVARDQLLRGDGATGDAAPFEDSHPVPGLRCVSRRDQGVVTCADDGDIVVRHDRGTTLASGCRNGTPVQASSPRFDQGLA
jgi:hypothetical protein